MFFPIRFFFVYSMISLPVIYGKAMHLDLDKYLFKVDENEPNKNQPEKVGIAFRINQQRFLYGLVVMNLYTCSKEDCSTYFQDAKKLKKDFETILEKGWKNSEDDRLSKQSSKANSGGAYALYQRFLGTGQLVQPGDPRRLDKLLKGTERLSFVEYDDPILKMYQDAYESVMRKLENPLYLLDKYLINPSPSKAMDVFFKKHRNRVLRGLVMMHLYACKTHKDLCSKFFVYPQNLKMNLETILSTGWKSSEQDRTVGGNVPSPYVSYDFFLLVMKEKEKYRDAVQIRMMKSEAIFYISSRPLRNDYNPTLEYLQVYAEVVDELQKRFDCTLSSERNTAELPKMYDTDKVKNIELTPSELEETENEPGQLGFVDPFSEAKKRPRTNNQGEEILLVIPPTAAQQEEMHHEPEDYFDDLFDEDKKMPAKKQRTDNFLPVIPLFAAQQEEMQHEPKYDLDELFSKENDEHDEDENGYGFP